MLTKEC
jgi:hypothetical protein